MGARRVWALAGACAVFKTSIGLTFGGLEPLSLEVEEVLVLPMPSLTSLLGCLVAVGLALLCWPAGGGGASLAWAGLPATTTYAGLAWVV